MKLRNVAFGILLLASCGKSGKEPLAHATVIHIVRDITDTPQNYIEPEAILALYGFEYDKNQAAEFSQTLITDKVYNPTQTIRISDGKTTDKNNENQEEYFRERFVLSFYNAIRNGIADFGKQYYTREPLTHSECFATIAGELDELAKGKGIRHILVVYSNLLENSVYTCYTPEGKRLLENDPEKVKKILLRHHSLPDKLSGVSVYFVWSPPSREADALFGKMVTVYRQLLQDRGARVIVQSQGNYFQP